MFTVKGEVEGVCFIKYMEEVASFCEVEGYISSSGGVI